MHRWYGNQVTHRSDYINPSFCGHDVWSCSCFKLSYEIQNLPVFACGCLGNYHRNYMVSKRVVQEMLYLFSFPFARYKFSFFCHTKKASSSSNESSVSSTKLCLFLLVASVINKSDFYFPDLFIDSLIIDG